MKSNLAITDYHGWAATRSIHPAVVSFLTSYGRLNPLGWVLTGSEGWTTVSGITKDETLSEVERRAALHEVLGVEGADLFLRFHHFWDRLPAIDAVLTGTAGEMPEDLRDPILGTIFVPNVAAKLTDRLRLIRRDWGETLLRREAYGEWAQQADNAMTYFAPLPVEHRVKFIATLLDQDGEATRALFERPAFAPDKDMFEKDE